MIVEVRDDYNLGIHIEVIHLFVILDPNKYILDLHSDKL
jgi:hypothetical protein